MNSILKSVLISTYFLLTFSTQITLGSVRVVGTVFIDVNANGIKDKNENGIKDIPVSNGRDIVFTNDKGHYQIDCPVSTSIFPILPSGYAFPKKFGNIPNANFRYITLKSESNSLEINFGIKKEVEKEKYSFAAVGDIQMKDASEVNYAAKSIIPELMMLHDNDFNLFLGDLVNDNPALFPVVKDMLNSIGNPTWTVYGNHDREVNDSTTSDAGYNKVFGSSVYSFNKGKAHFMILNNMLPKGRYGYEESLSDGQLEFVENDLKLVPKDRLIVIALHGSLKFTSNKDRLIALLAERTHVLVLSGHTHTVARYFHKNNASVIHEIGVGASCGMWWTGEKNEFGVPTSLMQCGSLPDYFRINIDQNNYSFTYKAIGFDTLRQMEIWIDPLKPVDEMKKDSLVLTQTDLVANVFGGSDSTVVTLRIDSFPAIPMPKTAMISPNVSNLIELYNQKTYPTTSNSRNPLRKKMSPHVWQVSVPKVKSGIHVIRISAVDRYGLHAEGTQLFFFP
jgi:predicted phosphodiesterase